MSLLRARWTKVSVVATASVLGLVAGLVAVVAIDPSVWSRLIGKNGGLLSDAGGADVAPVELLPPFYGDEQGHEQFTRVRHTQLAPASLFVSGKMFNAGSCAECHRQSGIGGGGPNENNVQLFNKFYTTNRPGLALHFGSDPGVVVLHRRSQAPDYADWRLALIEQYAPHDPEVAGKHRFNLPRAIPCGDQNPAGLFCISIIGPDAFEQRNTPPLFGLGLIESIDQGTIDAVAAGQPENIRGRSPRLKGGGRGRFGWKSNTATLTDFNENACSVELGLSTPRFAPSSFRGALFLSTYVNRRPAAVQAIPMLRALGSVTSHPGATIGPRTLDMSNLELAALTRFVASLPAPRRVIDPAKAAEVALGESHFQAIGCAQCHLPSLGHVSGVYSDMLLHSIGTSGSAYYGDVSPTPDGPPPQFDIVRGDEFRTPPLWGVADSAPYLHDGSAATLDEAILRHSVQATSSTVGYQSKLTSDDRKNLIAFLESLRAP
jgi:CxxC motif-containing protein (DUF1111 family)